jgi:hypothetical protein
MKNKILLFFIPLSIFAANLVAQSSLLDELGTDEKTIEYAKYSFKTNRIINMHSLENTAEGVLDMKISHRFGVIDEGIYDLFGMDAATQRIGFDYGITDNLCVGVNRNSVHKALDGFVKYRLLRQSKGKVYMPITLSLISSMAVETQKWADPTRENYFSSRLFYTNQILIGRKFNDVFTLELAPTIVHRNLTATTNEKNTVYAMGIGGRVRLNRRTTFNAEYIYVLPNQLGDGYKNSLSIGVDIETGGHVFQLHFTNSNSMSEYSYITQTEKNWGKNAVRFGFNVSRVFTMYDTKGKKK